MKKGVEAPAHRGNSRLAPYNPAARAQNTSCLREEQTWLGEVMDDIEHDDIVETGVRVWQEMRIRDRIEPRRELDIGRYHAHRIDMSIVTEGAGATANLEGTRRNACRSHLPVAVRIQ